MTDKIVLKLGDVMLKGRNKKRIMDAFVHHISEVLDTEAMTLERHHDRCYIHLNSVAPQSLINKLHTISGLHSYAFVKTTTRDLASIMTTIVSLIDEINKPGKTFKVSTKRNDKSFPINSMTLSSTIGEKLLAMYPSWQVDVKNPDVTIHIEIRKSGIDIYLNKIPLMGGFPVGMLGTGLLLMSGGLDSPVAGYLSMKQGIALEIMHFESTPMTSIEAAQKVIELTKKIALYAPKQKILLHMVPFEKLHQALINNIPEEYVITIMRRMMLRIASRYAMQQHIPVLITGESVGQVASQTLESIHVINAVTSMPIIRPLATMDKNDIIEIAKVIDTYDTSIQPFDDCCSVYVPKSPTIKPRNMYANRYERLFDFQQLIDYAMKETHTISVSSDLTITLNTLGLTVQTALKGED